MTMHDCVAIKGDKSLAAASISRALQLSSHFLQLPI